jgi:hypothetical protein
MDVKKMMDDAFSEVVDADMRTSVVLMLAKKFAYDTSESMKDIYQGLLSGVEDTKARDEISVEFMSGVASFVAGIVTTAMLYIANEVQTDDKVALEAMKPGVIKMISDKIETTINLASFIER